MDGSWTMQNVRQVLAVGVMCLIIVWIVWQRRWGTGEAKRIANEIYEIVLVCVGTILFFAISIGCIWLLLMLFIAPFCQPCSVGQ